MNDTIIAIVFLVLLFLGLPLLILWLKDRGGFAGTAIKRLIGLVALAIGLAIIGWVIYNLFAPTDAFRANYKTIFQLALPLLMVWFGWKWLTDDGPGIESTPINFDCPELQASVGKAKASLPWFLEQVNKNVDGAFIKFPLQTPNGLTEHIWAYVHGFRDGAFNVSIANDSFDKGQDTSGRRDVALNQVEDWQIMSPDRRIKGAYSLIALFEHLEAKGRKLSRKMRKQKAQLIDATPNPGEP
jgi:hypothetical protein